MDTRGLYTLTNLHLLRKVKYKPRKHRVLHTPVRHAAKRQYEAFSALGEDVCASRWEMDTTEGSKLDDVHLLILLHKPTHFQFALPIKDGSCEAVQDALKLLQNVLGSPQAMRRIFSLVLTDNGSEF